jgi:hypothetical protein
MFDNFVSNQPWCYASRLVIKGIIFVPSPLRGEGQGEGEKQ